MQKSIITLSFGLVLLAGCGNKEDFGKPNDMSEGAKAYLGMRAGSANAFNRVQSEAMSLAFGGLFANFSGRLTDGDYPSDDPWYWESCAEITETENPDGSITITYDYGEGCDEGWGDYTYRMWGKYTMTYLYDFTETETSYAGSYYFAMSYENFGGSYSYEDYTYNWGMEGASEYEGSSEYNWNTLKFSGHYTHSDDMAYTQDEDTYNYSSLGDTEYNQKRSVTKLANYLFSNGDNFYSSEVIKPLIFKFNCQNDDDYVFTYVSGRERIQWSHEGESGEFVIDYGDGECDNIIIIIENGKKIKVDLGKGRFDDWVVTNG
jgi:hypothetical protein